MLRNIERASLLTAPGKPKTFETARLAREWLEGTAVKVREGTFVDRRSLGTRPRLRNWFQRFVKAQMQVGGRRRGAAEDLGHVPAITGDGIGKLKLSKLTASAVRGFRDRQQEAYSAGTVVKRLNLLAGIIAHAMAEWDLPMPMNPGNRKGRVRVPTAPTSDATAERPTSVFRGHQRGSRARPRSPKTRGEERLIDAVAKSEWPDDLPVTKARLGASHAAGGNPEPPLGRRDFDFEQRLLTIRGRHSRGTKTGAHQKTARRKTEIGWEVRPMMPEAADLLLVQLANKQPKPDDLVFASGGNNAFKVRIGRYISRRQTRGLDVPRPKAT